MSLPPKTQLPLFQRETRNHLMNTVKKLRLCHPLAKLLEPFLQLKDQFTSLKSTTPSSTPTTELMTLTDKMQHLTMMLQPHSALQSSEEPSAQNHAGVDRHLACNTERIKPHHDNAARYPYIWWTGLLKAGRLVHGHRNYSWHPNREPDMPAWGQITQPHLHTHQWGHSNRKVLWWSQGYP